MFYDIEFNFIDILIFISLLAVLTVSVIQFLRYRLSKASRKIQGGKQKNIAKSISTRNKYPEVDAFKYSNSLLQYGLIIAIGFSLGIISWTNYEKSPVRMMEIEIDLDMMDMVDPPRIYFPKPPPPPPIFEPIFDDIEPIDDTPDLISEKIEITVKNNTLINTKIIADSSITNKTANIILKKPEIKDDIEEIVNFADQMPRFPGCQGEPNKESKKICAQKKLLSFIYNNLKYPLLAKEANVQGTCILQFVVSKTGDIKDLKIVRDIGAGCGKASLRAISKMNNMEEKWEPGLQRGIPVNVRYTLPVKFKLE